MDVLQTQKSYLGQSAFQILKTARISQTKSGAFFIFCSTRDHDNVSLVLNNNGNLLIAKESSILGCIQCTPMAKKLIDRLDKEAEKRSVKQRKGWNWLF